MGPSRGLDLQDVECDRREALAAIWMGRGHTTADEHENVLMRALRRMGTTQTPPSPQPCPSRGNSETHMPTGTLYAFPRHAHVGAADT